MQNLNPITPLRLAFIVALFISVSLNAQIKEFGIASFYADKFQGRITASGEVFDQEKFTAAHRTLPFGTIVKVINLDNSKTVEVTVNDRGPFVDNRVIDLSRAAAKALAFDAKGTANVRIEVVRIPAPTESKPTVVATTTKKTKTEPTPVSEQVVESAPKEYFTIETQQIAPTGFGIQIASYQEAANLIKLMNTIQKEINKPLMVQVSENNGNKVYRILIGPYAQRDEAEKIKAKLNGYSDSFIVAL